MGAWGIGNLENDDAADWLADLAEANSSAAVHQTLAAAAQADYLEAPVGTEALAAAEVVAAALGRPPTGEGSDRVATAAAQWPDVAALQTDAQRATGAVLGQETSELAELWEEAGETERWRTVVGDLQQRLRSI
jgi:hypothetical protein